MPADVHLVLSVSLNVLKPTQDEDVYIGLTIAIADTVGMWGHTDRLKLWARYTKAFALILGVKPSLLGLP